MRDRVILRLPAWVDGMLGAREAGTGTQTERMALVLALAARNVAEGTGGPFAAAVFARDSGRLLSVGVNVVVPARCSSAHAEIMALSLAQQAEENHDLALSGEGGCELVCSAEPCAMCLGAVIWSGVRRLVCAARDADIRAIGFDEGPKPRDWREELLARGIGTEVDVGRDEAVRVLQEYVAGGGPVYNAGSE